ncbi:hypothetical protein [Hydrocarboniphaga sp.]|uniref:hypothetical protein n=1 Tax=Hydrocarboniphaga sp. TaxID=2033016 RepID=UPI003D0C6D44
MWNETLHLPEPPVAALANVTADFWATAAYSSLALCTLIYGLYYWYRTGRPIILLMLIGGALCSTVEPFVNVVGAVWHPTVNQVTAFTLMGRGMPWFIVTGYTFYFGVLGSLSYLAFRKGVTTRQFWLWATVPMLVDVAMEELMLYWDLYYYYGNQPLILINKLPLWWVPCNSLGELLGVCLLVKAEPLLRGWRQLLIPLLIPMGDAVAYAAISLPSWIVVNTPVPDWLSQLGGASTLGLALLVLHGLAKVIPTDSALAHALSVADSGKFKADSRTADTLQPQQAQKVKHVELSLH